MGTFYPQRRLAGRATGGRRLARHGGEGTTRRPAYGVRIGKQATVEGGEYVAAAMVTATLR